MERECRLSRRNSIDRRAGGAADGTGFDVAGITAGSSRIEGLSNMSITTVTAAEDLCLPTIGTLAAELTDALNNGDPVRLDLSAAAAPDLSVLQLVESARSTAAAEQRDFALAAPANATVAALLDRAGFLTALSDDDRRFWFHGDTEQ
ncbi:MULTISPECIES: STAS domain-containing protein [Sphingomonas]|nr:MULTISPECIES: STAS domain-containing protein [Sphingomonas]